MTIKDRIDRLAHTLELLRPHRLLDIFAGNVPEGCGCLGCVEARALFPISPDEREAARRRLAEVVGVSVEELPGAGG